MARTIGRLSAVKVQSLKAPGYHADGGNLYFRIAHGRARGWIFRFAMRGRTRDMGLGSYPDISLAKARELAAECRRMVATVSIRSRRGRRSVQPRASRPSRR
jgi:hypothetical protein